MSFASEIGALVAAHSLGTEGSLKTFTVARTEAVLKLRAAHPAEGVSWVLPLIQAIRCLPGDMRLTFSQEARGGEELLELAVFVEGARPAALEPGWAPELAGLLSDGLREALPAQTSLDLDCVKQRLGMCVNRLLATHPMFVEVEVGGSARRWQRREDTVSDRGEEDPYESLARSEGEETSAHESEPVLRVRISRPRTLRARWWALLGRRDDWAREVVRVVESRALGVEVDGLQLMVRAHWRPPTTIRMEGLGWFVPVDGEQLWLVREGVRLLDLSEASRQRGVTPATGMVYAPYVLTTALGDAPRINEGFDAVLAWLDEARAGAQLTSDGGGEAWLEREPPTRFTTVRGLGRTLSLEEVERRVRTDGEIRFVWRHQVRAGLKMDGGEVGVDLRVLSCTPSEVAALRARLPPDTVIPHSVVGRAPRKGTVQVEKLQQLSLSPIPLVEDRQVVHRGELGAVRLQATIRAFVVKDIGSARALHVEREGQMFVTIFGREIIRLRGFDPGLVMWAELRAHDALQLPSVANLQKDQALLKELHRLARRVLSDVIGALMERVLAEASPTQLPWLRHQLEVTATETLALAYEEGADGDTELAWAPLPVLQTPVGEDQHGSVTAEALLRRVANGSVPRPVQVTRGQAVHLRDVSLRRDPALHGLLSAILPASKLAFPMSEELWAVPAVWSERARSLRMDRDAVERALATSLHEPVARGRLLAHLLVSRVAGLEDFGLEKVRLFDRYDPLSKSPHTLLSFDEVLALGGCLPWVFPTTASRALTRPVLCLTPGVAALLGKLTTPPKVSRSQLFRRRTTTSHRQASAAVHDGERGGSPRSSALVSREVDTPLVAGVLFIDGEDVRGIELWHRELRVETVTLPGALAVVGGRLTVKTRIVPQDGPGRATLLDVLCREATPLVDRLATFRLLAGREAEVAARADAAWEMTLKARDDRDSAALQWRLRASRGAISDLPTGVEARSLRQVARLDEDQIPRGLWIPKMLARGFEVEARTARFSKKLLEFGSARHKDGKLTARLGLRHRWSRRVLGRGIGGRAGTSAPSAFELLVCTALIIAELGRWPELARRSSRHRRAHVLKTMIVLLGKIHARDLSRGDR
ncbi:MAG: hypothetical protein ACPHRO_00150 [Nannocystaceae bacterium]